MFVKGGKSRQEEDSVTLMTTQISVSAFTYSGLCSYLKGREFYKRDVMRGRGHAELSTKWASNDKPAHMTSHVDSAPSNNTALKADGLEIVYRTSMKLYLPTRK